MKVRQGDRFNLSAGARLWMVYFEGGRQEMWSGPAVFRAGTMGSEGREGAEPLVTVLPAAVPPKIAKIPEFMRLARLGGTTIRGKGAPARPPLSPQTLEKVVQARASYQSLRGQMPEDDVIPELFLFSTLQEYSLYDEMKVLASEMERRQPDNQAIRDLSAWVAKRAAH